MRRTFTDEQKAEILAVAKEKGVGVAANQNAIAPGLIYKWRRDQTGGVSLSTVSEIVPLRTRRARKNTAKVGNAVSVSTSVIARLEAIEAQLMTLKKLELTVLG